MGTKYTGTPEQGRALDAFIALMRAANAVSQRLSRQKAFGDLTTSQFGVLEALMHLGPLSQRELADKVLKSTGNLVTVIDNLQKRGLVERQRSTADRRVIHVSLTPAGRKTIEGLFPAHVEAIVRALSPLDDRAQAELKRLCRELGTRQVVASPGLNDTA